MESQVSRGPTLERARQWRIAFIVLTVLTVLFYIIGGALVGASYNCTTTSRSYYYTYYYSCVNLGMWNGGVALLALASLSFILWVVCVILRFTSWYRQPVRGVNTTNNAPVTTESKYAPAATTTPVAATTGTTAAPTHFCQTCEAQVTGSYCGNCGTAQTAHTA